jgi:hypothetical protein
MEDGPLVKRAADLEPDTAALLGVQSVSPSTLKNLDAQAAQPAAQESLQPPESSQDDVATDEEADGVDHAELEQAAAGVDLGGFDRVDEEPPPAEEPPPEPPLPSRLTHGKLFTDKRAHPLQILDVLTMRYQEDWVEWEPETLWWALRRDFGPVGEVTRNKIMALRLAVSTDAPWLDWDTFENCSLAWNDVIPLFGAYQPVTPAQAAFGVHVLRSIRADEEFRWEVRVYIAAILEENGFVFAPEEFFDGAQEVIDRKLWLVGLKTELADAWEKIRDIDPREIEWDEGNPLHVHLVKLAVINLYLQEREALREKVPGGGSSSRAVSPPVPA